jgi:hypothetical protein
MCQLTRVPQSLDLLRLDAKTRGKEHRAHRQCGHIVSHFSLPVYAYFYVF